MMWLFSFFENNLENLLNVPIDIKNISYMIKNIDKDQIYSKNKNLNKKHLFFLHFKKIFHYT